MRTRLVSCAVQIMIIVGVLVMGWNPAQAEGEAWSSRGTIQWVEGGWSLDVMTVMPTPALINPGRCPTTNYGYATAQEDPGHSLFHTLAMTAFLNKREVQFLIAGPGICSYGKPKIIAVKMY